MNVDNNKIERQTGKCVFGIYPRDPLCSHIVDISPSEFYAFVQKSVDKNISWVRGYISGKVFAVYSNAWVITQDISSLSDYELSVVKEFWNKVAPYKELVVRNAE